MSKLRLKLPISVYMMASRSDYLTVDSKIVVLVMSFTVESRCLGIVFANNENVEESSIYNTIHYVKSLTALIGSGPAWSYLAKRHPQRHLAATSSEV